MYEIYVIFYDDCGEYKETTDICMVYDLAKARALKYILEYYYKNIDSIKTIVGFSKIPKLKSE